MSNEVAVNVFALLKQATDAYPTCAMIELRVLDANGNMVVQHKAWVAPVVPLEGSGLAVNVGDIHGENK